MAKKDEEQTVAQEEEQPQQNEQDEPTRVEEELHGDPQVVAEEPDQPTNAPEKVPNVYGSPFGRRVIAKAVLYTDGLSGDADMNHERAYEYAERLQSNNPRVRAAGDVSLSDSAKQVRSKQDTKEAEAVTGGSRTDTGQ